MPIRIYLPATSRGRKRGTSWIRMALLSALWGVPAFPSTGPLAFGGDSPAVNAHALSADTSPNPGEKGRQAGPGATSQRALSSGESESSADARSLYIYSAKAQGNVIWAQYYPPDGDLAFSTAAAFTPPVLYRLDTSASVTAEAPAPVAELRGLLNRDDPTTYDMCDVIAPIDEQSVWCLFEDEAWVEKTTLAKLNHDESVRIDVPAVGHPDVRHVLGRYQCGTREWNLFAVGGLFLGPTEMTAIDSDRVVLNGLGGLEGERSWVFLFDAREKGVVWQAECVPMGEIVHAYSPSKKELALLTKRGIEFFAVKEGSVVNVGRSYDWSHFRFHDGHGSCDSRLFHLAASRDFDWFFIGCEHRCFKSHTWNWICAGVLYDKEMCAVGTRVGYMSSRHVYFPDAHHVAVTYWQPEGVVLESIRRDEPMRTAGIGSKVWGVDGALFVLSRHTKRAVERF